MFLFTGNFLLGLHAMLFQTGADLSKRQINTQGTQRQPGFQTIQPPFQNDFQRGFNGFTKEGPMTISNHKENHITAIDNLDQKIDNDQTM